MISSVDWGIGVTCMVIASLAMMGAHVGTGYYHKHLLIKRRGPLVLLVLQNTFLCSVVMILVLVMWDDRQHCLFLDIGLIFHMYELGLVYFLRCLMFLFQCRIAGKIQTRSPSDATLRADTLVLGENGFFFRYRRWVQPMGLFLLFVLGSCLGVSTLLALSYASDWNCVLRQEYIQFYGIGVLSMQFMWIAVLGRLLSREKEHDMFGMFAELRALLFAVPICACAIGIQLLLDDHLYYTLLSILVSACILFVISVVLPLLQIRHATTSGQDKIVLRLKRSVVPVHDLTLDIPENEHSPNQLSRTIHISERGTSSTVESKSNSVVRPQLCAVLASDDGYPSFLKYATREFSHESILFWKAVQNYKSVCIRYETCLETKTKEVGTLLVNLKASRIMHTFVLDHAPLQVNLSSEMYAELTSEWQRVSLNKEPVSLTPSSRLSKRLQRFWVPKTKDDIVPTHVLPLFMHLFDSAEECVLQLLESDVFTRYVVSLEYQSYVAKMNATTTPRCDDVTHAAKHLDVTI